MFSFGYYGVIFSSSILPVKNLTFEWHVVQSISLVGPVLGFPTFYCHECLMDNNKPFLLFSFFLSFPSLHTEEKEWKICSHPFWTILKLFTGALLRWWLFSRFLWNPIFLTSPLSPFSIPFSLAYGQALTFFLYYLCGEIHLQ